MKKFVLAVLVFALSLSAFTSVCASPAAESVIVKADSGYTEQTKTTAKDVVLGFETLFANAKKTSVRRDSVKPLAGVALGYAGGQNTVYTVYKSNDGLLYIYRSNNLYSIDADKFYKLADQTGRSFYTLRPLPAARANDVGLAVVTSSYMFEKLDGKFYKTQYSTVPLPALNLKDGKLPVPELAVQPKTAKVAVTSAKTNQAVWSGTLAEFKSYSLKKSGSYRVEITAVYDRPHAKGEVVYAYTLGQSTDISFSVDGASTNPGEVVFLRGKNIPEGAKISVETDIQFTPKFFRDKNGDMVALLPVSYYTAAGTYYVTLSCGETKTKFTITAGDKKFTVQNLTVPAATAEETINSKKANDEYEKYIAPIRMVSDTEQYWSGRFIWPLKVNGAITTEFGMIRYTNNNPTPSRHGALDIAVPAGTPVYASGAGRVLYSGLLQLTGNTVVIEHGYGLKTWHYHMNGLNVKTGDMVKQGQQIGTVGSTGFSTGAHLHFGMSINNVFVNPYTAIYTGLFDENDK